MNLFEIYESLPPTTLVKAADRAGINPASMRSRLRAHPIDFEAWRVALGIVAELGERASEVGQRIQLLLDSATEGARDERAD